MGAGLCGGFQARWFEASVGGPSGPMLSGRIAAIRNEGIGPEGPPTVQPRGGSNISALGRNGRGA
ncbi:DUF6053 domain-containing protein [Lysobacter enzymogenes]|uniref:DUF6053 domain-containing protein n=1 Tax=Lysobacter enzymogenes TaxID=69 RepID=UPI003D18BC8D